MKVLLLGSGAREHALAWALRRSPRLSALWAAPGSQAMSGLAEPAPVDPCDPAAVTAFCRERGIGLLVVGPEAPLAAGTADAARAAGVPVFGPGREAARLESSKAFAKDFMARHGLPCARSRNAASAEEALEAAGGFSWRCAVKADGLAGGKGVFVCRSRGEAEAAVRELAARPWGKVLVVEELLEGPELSVIALLDGSRWAALAPARDHKRLLDGDAGPNTGGMGAFAPVPLDAALLGRIEKEILDRAVAGLKADGLDYRGALYAGLMLTAAGPRLLEFNARLGDPEAQVLLPLLDGDFLELAASCAAGAGPAGRLPARPGAAVGVVLAAEGYPEAPRPGARLDLSALEGERDLLVFHAATRREGSAWSAAGGRVLTVVGLGPDAAAARSKAYGAVSRLAAPGLVWRSDVAASAAGASSR